MISNIVNFVNCVRIVVIQANRLLHWAILIISVANLKSKKISNDQELIQSDPTSGKRLY